MVLTDAYKNSFDPTEQRNKLRDLRNFGRPLRRNVVLILFGFLYLIMSRCIRDGFNEGELGKSARSKAEKPRRALIAGAILALERRCCDYNRLFRYAIVDNEEQEINWTVV